MKTKTPTALKANSFIKAPQNIMKLKANSIIKPVTDIRKLKAPKWGN